MNIIQSLIATGTVVLVSLSSLPIALSETVNPNAITGEPGQVRAERPASFKPGLNRVVFQSEGERMVGNLYLPISYKSGSKLPVIVVTGA
ncbi:hypothetical protein [Trichocoleus sp. FACHB-262]|uniref:hypothetical protein n=1 Tax=Trichocoleus sp. FACHB-262 TaxID=2692869 RepID=UPI0018F02B04|nr:hypothetical protein [Trichocoleus sp. FACHB-262]